MRWCLVAMVSAALVGCRVYTLDVEGRIQQRAAVPTDVWPAALIELPTPAKSAPPVAKEEPLSPTFARMFSEPEPQEEEEPADDATATYRDINRGKIVRVQALKKTEPEKKKPRTIMDQLELPEELKRYGGPPIQLPAPGSPEMAEAIKKHFPPLPPLPALPLAHPGPLALSDLQQAALRSNPIIRQAHLEVEAARGNAVQVGLYPNTTIGYEGQSLNQANAIGQRSAGQQGVFLEQTFKTGGKLHLARAAAEREVRIAEQKVRAAESEVQTQVRNAYFAVLSARKTFEVAHALSRLTDEVFHVLLQQVQAGEVAPYEPMQIRVLAMQSRGLVLQSYNRYIASWKQLAARLGTPEMPLTEVAGQIDMPVPHFEHAAVLDHVLRHHSEVVTAALGVDRDQVLLKLAEVQPVPDLNVHLSLLKDTTADPHYATQNVTVGFPVPLFNRNQGAIQQARAVLHRSIQENARVRNDLSGRVAEVFNRYENNRLLLDLYKTQMLPNQVQAFRAALARHSALGGKEISYNDVVTVQQNLAGLLTSYLTALHEQWVAVNDIGNLLQTKDLFQTCPLDEVAPVPDIQEIVRDVRTRPRR